MILDKTVSTCQNAFVEERQILDAALVANEVANLERRKMTHVLK